MTHATKLTDTLYRYKLTVLRVVDGDTLCARIDLGFHTFIEEYIRLYDVDTPEIRGRYATPEGHDAMAFVKDWLSGIGTGTQNTLGTINEFGWPAYMTGLTMDSRKYDPRDRYGRSLAVIYRPGDPISLNEALVRAGHIKPAPLA